MSGTISNCEAKELSGTAGSGYGGAICANSGSREISINSGAQLTGNNASIGVYVADGPNYDEYYKYGIADRNFATYHGSNPKTAGLEAFFNDRDEELRGYDGDLIDENVSGKYYIMWPGKNLYIHISQFDVQMDADGKPIPLTNASGDPLTDSNGNKRYTPVVNPASVAGAKFTLTNDGTNEEVWSGTSDGNGLVTVPWSKVEAMGGNTAIFKENSSYTLRQTAIRNT